MSMKIPIFSLQNQRKTTLSLLLIRFVQIREYRIEGRYNWRGPPYHMIIYALQTVLHLYKKCSEQVIVYTVIVHQTNISYSNEVPPAKHVWSYSRAGRVSCISLLFYTPWFQVGNIECPKYTYHKKFVWSLSYSSAQKQIQLKKKNINCFLPWEICITTLLDKRATLKSQNWRWARSALET